MTCALGSRAALIATAGQAKGGVHSPMVPASSAAASASKLTRTLTFLDIVVTQESTLLHPASADTSHRPPAQALIPRPPDAVAVSLTEVPRGKPALQLPETASPLAMVQLIPAGVEYTVPLPPAPPATVRVNVVGSGTKVGATVRSRSIVIWHTCGASTSGVQVTPHSASSFSTAPPAAAAVTLTTVPGVNVPTQVPLEAAP